MNEALIELIDNTNKSKKIICGIGIDTEDIRILKYNISKYLLHKNDTLFHTTNNKTLLKIWTIKESLFKATPNNKHLVLRDFYITSFTQNTGTATCAKRPDLSYSFINECADESICSIALCFIG